MQAPALTRRRRPFLAPVWLGLAGCALLALVGWSLWHGARTTLVLLVLPVEGPLAQIADPPLSAEGEERAQHLARILGAGTAVDAVYVSDERRSQQTAAPLLEELHRPPQSFSVQQGGPLAARLLREHAGGTVVVVAGGATAAQVLGALSGGDVAAASGGEMYLVSVPRFGRARLLRLHL
jgi:broad specificity phosphatase PhoE